MGTNFYKIIPIKKSGKELLKKLIDEDKFTIDMYCNFTFDEDSVKLLPTEIHIGKRSAGWKFIFDCNNWMYFGKNEKSLLNWIYDDSDGSIIKDEYGKVYTREEFMKEVDETYTLDANGKERWDHSAYIKEHPEEYHSFSRGCSDMYLGKYRVSTYTDFS